jgi:hypothetical protein
MRMSEDVKINITAETAGVEGKLNGTAAGVTAVGVASAAAAPAVRTLAGTVDVLRVSFSAVQKALGWLAVINLVITWLIRLYDAVKNVIAWFKKLDDPAANQALDKTAESAKAAADSVKKLADSYDALAAARKKLRDDAAAEANSFLGVIDAQQQAEDSADPDPASRENKRRQNQAFLQRRKTEAALANANTDETNAGSAIADNRSQRATLVARMENAQRIASPFNPNATPSTKAKASAAAQAFQTAIEGLDAALPSLQSAARTAANAAREAKTRFDNSLVDVRSVDANIQKENRDKEASTAAATAAKQADDDAKKKKNLADVATKRTDIEKSAQEKIKAITVDAPIAASSAAAAGGFMGGSMNNAARLSEQREFKRDAIEREKVDLLAKINNKLDD